MAPMSAEATVVRNYIDWIPDLPWSEKTENKNTLNESEASSKRTTTAQKVKERIWNTWRPDLVEKNKASILVSSVLGRGENLDRQVDSAGDKR
jgi:ATP-dependent Lon protease